MKHTDTVDPRLDLVLERHIQGVTPDLLWTAWTEPEHLVEWFTPRPWSTARAELDVRPGGKFFVVMRSPEGELHENAAGCYLEVVENERLVWTDALGPDYRPNASPFMTAIITMAHEGNGTSYRAIVRHNDEAAKKQHEEMGFIEGWGTALDQLIELARKLAQAR